MVGPKKKLPIRLPSHIADTSMGKPRVGFPRIRMQPTRDGRNRRRDMGFPFVGCTCQIRRNLRERRAKSVIRQENLILAQSFLSFTPAPFRLLATPLQRANTLALALLLPSFHRAGYTEPGMRRRNFFLTQVVITAW